MASLQAQLEEGCKEGMRLAFENNAYKNCDGADDPEDRCPSEGTCVCSYVHWKRLPWWRRMFTAQQPRPSVEACRHMVFSRMADEAVEELKVKRRAARLSTGGGDG